MRSLIFLLCIICQGTSILAQEMNIGALVVPVDEKCKFIDSDYHIWGASVVKGFDGKYHMFYSRWKYELGHMAWVTHSEIAYAVAEKAEGPYEHVNVALPARGREFWDGTTTHNPTIIKQSGKYYLYYMGTTSAVEAQQPTSMKNKDWWMYRNNQRIGVAWSENPSGPWHRLDHPIIDVAENDDAPDALMTSNPAINISPNGGVFAIYKAVGKQKGWKPVDMTTNESWQVAKGSQVKYMLAFADHPLGPFKKESKTIFELEEANGEHMIAEDPYVWSDHQQYYAIVTDIKGYFTGDKGALALMESKDGLHWEAGKFPKVLPSKIPKQDGTTTSYKIERPQLLLEEGKPTQIFGALGITVDGVYRGHACNLRIPLSVE
ncbi:glycoside hydrolase family protein [Flammeovirga sp. EKP202]|uniref:glycoside hydrolase family protein n=1 Tax=Flammeovirga sp. EKP202 TaxID=2770592 RepID=UPI00165FC67A|nr:glycoside hydrolase family protein [Flammeovirga sp. EKP202]MBD0404742.1 glycoside hydrolase family protein [Flammeovirga sp. EKP202]